MHYFLLHIWHGCLWCPTGYWQHPEKSYLPFPTEVWDENQPQWVIGNLFQDITCDSHSASNAWLFKSNSNCPTAKTVRMAYIRSINWLSVPPRFNYSISVLLCLEVQWDRTLPLSVMSCQLIWKWLKLTSYMCWTLHLNNGEKLFQCLHQHRRSKVLDR